MSCECQYKHIGPWRGSAYKQYFYTERKIRALTLYNALQEEETPTPELVAEDYDVPVEAVREAIHYCENNKELIQKEAEEELEIIRRNGWDRLPNVPAATEPAS